MVLYAFLYLYFIIYKFLYSEHVITLLHFVTIVFCLLLQWKDCFTFTKTWCVLWLFTCPFLSLSLLFLLGDNILTALNVARVCGMMSSHEQIIFVNASPPTATSMPLLRFHQGDSVAAAVSTQETMDILEQVLTQDLIYFIVLKQWTAWACTF